MTLGSPHLHLKEIGSTNDRARELAVAGAPHGATVTAGRQTAGRGRRGRSWQAPAGQALLLSVVLREAPKLLTLRAAVATASVCGDDALIKWPNDVLIDGRKVAGILCEQRPGEDWAIAGIGINVAVELEALDAELRQSAATLGLSPDQIPVVRGGLLAAFEHALELNDERLIRAWSERDALRGQRVRWDGGTGTAAGIDDDGRLLVDVGGAQRIALDSGEVSLVRSA